MTTLISKCKVTFEITGDRCRIVGSGFFGVIGAVGILYLIIHLAPELISFISSR